MKRSPYLARARRWSIQVRKSRSRVDKRRAAHQVCLALEMLTSGKAALELGRQSA